MNKTISMSIRVSEDELAKIKKVAQIESYSSYSEYVRRTIMINTDKILKSKKGDKKDEI